MGRKQPYKAIAAITAPKAPPTIAITPVGEGPAAANPLLVDTVASEPEFDGAVASGPNNAFVPASDRVGVVEAEISEGETGEDVALSLIIVTTFKSSAKLPSDMTLLVNRNCLVFLGTNPVCMPSQVRFAVDMSPCQLQTTSTVHAPGSGSVR